MRQPWHSLPSDSGLPKLIVAGAGQQERGAQDAVSSSVGPAGAGSLRWTELPTLAGRWPARGCGSLPAARASRSCTCRPARISVKDGLQEGIRSG